MDILNWIYLVKNKLRKTTIQNPDKDLVILGGAVGFSKRGDGYQSYGMHVTDFANDLLSGTDYIIVRATGTPEENAQEFIAAYAKADAADKDAEHRFTLVLAPGHYKFQETFLHETSFIDIVSLTGEQDVIFDLELNGQDPFLNGNNAYVYDLTIAFGTSGTLWYTDTLQEGQPFFLSIDGTVTSPIYGFDSAGLYFRGEAVGYPVFSNFVIADDQITTVTFKFIHSYNCSDQGVCVYLDGDTPAWNWGTNSTRIAAQYNCQSPYIYGVASSATTGFELTTGETYIAEFIYNPTAGTTTLVTKDLTGAVLDTIFINEVLAAGDYRIAFSADYDDADGIKTSPVMVIDTDYTKVSGIKTQEYTSQNYVNWAITNYGNNESDFYPLPLNVFITDYADVEVKNCTAGPFSFGADANFNASNYLYATFIDCTALGYSFGFGAYQIDSGAVFTNCSGGNNSFYIDDKLRGTYTNCTAGDNSFYSTNDNIEGTFVNCTAGSHSFRANRGFYNATFTNCTADNSSFYAENSRINNTSTFTNCTAGNNSFVADDDDNQAMYINCKAGADSFWAYYDFEPTCINCIAQERSFYSDDPYYDSNLYYCLLYNDTFDGGNNTQYCVDNL